MNEEETKVNAEEQQSNEVAEEQQEQQSPDAPQDGEAQEAVTIVIIESDEQLADLMARSVQACLRGVDADIQAVTGEHVKNTVIETLLEHMPHIKTERVVVMQHGQFLLQPMTLAEIALPKARVASTAYAVDVRFPAMYHKSILQRLLPYLRDNLPHADLEVEYHDSVYPDIIPVPIGNDWRKDPWLLPVVSENPDPKVIQELGARKRFLYVRRDEIPQVVLDFLNSWLAEDKGYEVQQ